MGKRESETENDRMTELERRLSRLEEEQTVEVTRVNDLENLFVRREATMEFLTRAIRALTLVVVKTSREMEIMLSVTPPNVRMHILEHSQIDPNSDTEIVVQDGQGKVAFVLATKEQMDKLAASLAAKLVDPKTGKPFSGPDTGAKRVEVVSE